jgi:hypothetical protein
VTLAGLLAACGGGGSNSSNASSSSGTTTVVVTPLTTQQLVEAAMLDSNGGAYTLASSLPAKGTPTSGVNYAYSQKTSITSTLSTTPQTVDALVDSLSPTLALPDFSTASPTRVMLNGALHTAANLPGRTNTRLYLVGSQVVRDTLDLPGNAIVFSNAITSVQNSTITGVVTGIPTELKTMPVLADLIANSNLTKNKLSFASGSGYSKLQEQRFGDTYFIEDCTVATGADRDPSPCDSNGTIEGVFPYTYGTTLFTLANGSIQTVQGLRAWVSTGLVPSSVSVTDAYLAFFELNGKVYRAILQKNGVTLKSKTSAGSVVDYSLYLNRTAVESIKTAFGS